MDSFSKETLFSSFKSVWIIINIFDKQLSTVSSKLKKTMNSITPYFKAPIFEYIN